jgi:hypothetical protein
VIEQLLDFQKKLGQEYKTLARQSQETDPELTRYLAEQKKFSLSWEKTNFAEFSGNFAELSENFAEFCGLLRNFAEFCGNFAEFCGNFAKKSL